MEIEARDLGFRYATDGFRLAVPRLAVPAGSTAAVVGSSGSGKTTLLHLIAGILVPDTGSLRLGDFSLPGPGEAARRSFRIARIGLVFQDFRLIDYLTVEENIRLPFRIHPALDWTEAVAARLAGLVESLGLAARRCARPGELSHGERQRVAIGRALLTAPRLVLADEPTGNLDAAARDRVLNLLFEETRRIGATLVVVTHDEDLSAAFDQVVDFQNLQPGPA
ncbi:MAG: ATP-binding cassette domain-containing protein [Puniceicoccaceae bacterium]|nr:MAG: ATP-binding cassette domain-containing protein [Puniceicoccaceae bacterium]